MTDLFYYFKTDDISGYAGCLVWGVHAVFGTLRLAQPQDTRIRAHRRLPRPREVDMVVRKAEARHNQRYQHGQVYLEFIVRWADSWGVRRGFLLYSKTCNFR